MEIDETKIGAKRKYGRGRAESGPDVWILGGVDRETKHIFLEIVEDRSRDTLLPVITANVTDGTTVYTDMWPAYLGLSDHGFDHKMVNHSTGFVLNGVNTNTIESLWGELKADLKIKRGLNREQLPGFLDEFVYRRIYRSEDIFVQLLDHIAYYYTVNDP